MAEKKSTTKKESDKKTSTKTKSEKKTDNKKTSSTKTRAKKTSGKKTSSKKTDNNSMLDEIKSYIENTVIGMLPEPDGMSDPVRNAMVYAVKAGGKRVRPLLMYLTYKAFSAASNSQTASEQTAAPGSQAEGADNSGTAEKSALPHDKAVEYFMAALEMIHTYSLIHDDLPALDNDDLRRGNPTVHKAFGEDVAILAGDGLLNYAYETAAKSFISCPGDIDVEKAVFILASKPGLYGMLGGQAVDVVLTGKRPTAEQLSYIYSNKTAALLECAMTIGGTLAGVSGENLDKLQNAAYYIGMAFQVQDDILDVTGTVEELGKDVSQDKKNGKITFVTIYGIEKAKEYVKQASLLAIKLVDEAYATITPTPQTDEYISILKNLITQMISRKN